MSPFLQRPSMHPVAQPASKWRDTPQRYGRISRWLHWSMALLLAWQFAGMLAKVSLGREAALTQLLSAAHAHVGLLLLCLAVVRIAWAWQQAPRRPHRGMGLRDHAAWLVQLGMYALMLLVPFLAALRMLGNDRPFDWLGVLPLNDGSGSQVAWMVAPANAVHGLLGWLLLALIVGHAVAALLHRYVWNDDRLPRMLGRVKDED